MSMTSLSFILFAVVTVLVYYLVPKRAQWVILLIASVIFYAAAGGWYLPFIGVTVLSTYLLARLISRHAAGDEERRRLMDFLAALRPQEFNVLHHRFLNAGPGAPECFVIQRNPD